MYSESDFNAMLGQGVKPVDRFVKLSKFGKKYFSKWYEDIIWVVLVMWMA